mmetsp:Transcript_109847/g.309780  ORF Transcript_109847/g.309780 Transcript_109847/m.309780 type:complete len:224 (-) Transcript_109847:426-1097(-)
MLACGGSSCQRRVWLHGMKNEFRSSVGRAQVPPVTLPPRALHDELVVRADGFHPVAHRALVCLRETELLRVEYSVLLQAAVAPTRHPCLLWFVPENAANAATALIWLGASKLASQLQLLVKRNGLRPGALELVALLAIEPPEDLNAVAVPHDQPPPAAMIPNDMLAAVLVHGHACLVLAVPEVKFHSFTEALLVNGPRPSAFLLLLEAEFAARTTRLKHRRPQ